VVELRRRAALGALVAAASLVVGAGACRRSDASPSARSVAAADSTPRGDTTSPLPQAAGTTPRDSTTRPPRTRTVLTPLEDSIAQRLTFAPRTQGSFIAAGRKQRLLLDVGRVDIEVRRDPARLAAYKRLVRDRFPLAAGARVRVRGPWGSDDATVDSVDTWNGRIVASLAAGPRVDSIVRHVDPLVALAVPSDSARPAVVDSCARTFADSTVARRIATFGDSVAAAMKLAEMPPYERLVNTMKSKTTPVAGCFGGARALVVVTLWAGNYEWVRERVFLMPDTGAPVPLRVGDYRFKAHDPIGAFDADGDGVDDLAARGLGEATGATVILKFTPDEKRFDRLASGFAWETR
jgi:hypothetical protein